MDCKEIIRSCIILIGEMEMDGRLDELECEYRNRIKIVKKMLEIVCIRLEEENEIEIK